MSSASSPLSLRTTIRPSDSSIAVGGVIQLSGLYPPASACTRTEPSALSISSRSASGRTALRRPEYCTSHLATIRRMGSETVRRGPDRKALGPDPPDGAAEAHRVEPPGGVLAERNQVGDGHAERAAARRPAVEIGGVGAPAADVAVDVAPAQRARRGD